jgi:hypothetical protein
LNDLTAHRLGIMSLSLDVSTPEGSEVDELEYANEEAQWLFYLCATQQVSAKRFERITHWLDTIPGAGEYFRCMCMQEYSDELLNAWVQFGVQARAKRLQESRARQWVKKGKNGTTRLKRWR